MINEIDYNIILIKAIKSSILNDEYCCLSNGRKKGKFYIAKYYIWLILFVFISPLKKTVSKIFICTPTPICEKRLSIFAENGEYFKFANMNKKISEIHTNLSVLSPYKTHERLQLLYNSFLFFIKNKNELKGYLHYTIECFFIMNYITQMKISKIISCVFPDRYTTLLSCLGKYLGIKVIGVQDGSAVNISPPIKLYFNEINVFGEFEEEIIKCYIENRDCKYVKTGFTSVLKWKSVNKNNKKYIAIASQDWHTDMTIKIIKMLMSIIDLNKYEIVLFPHYREKREEYAKILKKFPKLIIEYGARYSNIDLLITYYSTIVYDFWSINNNMPVLCLHIPGYEPSYYKRENVYVLQDIKELCIYIKDNLL